MTTRTLLASVIVTAPAALREELRHLSCERRAAPARRLRGAGLPAGRGPAHPGDLPDPDPPGQQTSGLAAVAAELEAQVAVGVEEMTPGLIAAEPGLGVLCAVYVLLSWSHAGRIHSGQAFAMLSGTAPVPVSSGRTDRPAQSGTTRMRYCSPDLVAVFVS